MKFKVIAFGDDGQVYVGEDADLSEAVSSMSECVLATGATEDQALLALSLHNLQTVARALPDDYFGSIL